MGLVHIVFRTGDRVDFERMLDDILGRATIAALTAATQVEHEAAARGTLASSGTPIVMGAAADTAPRIRPSGCVAGPKLAALTAEMTQRMGTAASRINLTQVSSKARERFDHRTDNALCDVEIGFIQGRSAIVTENSTTQSKALRLLKALYDATRNKTEPVSIDEIETGLSGEELKAAWHYLKDRGLIHLQHPLYRVHQRRRN
jgi:hypothetical protein